MREQRRIIIPDSKSDSIANIGVTDRALRWGDGDAMGFYALARGISLFLRNSNTGLPLVLAVNGHWGSGKSSLMNLLQANMRNTAQTVWFNAWHHESETQLLGALLQAVRTQSLGDMWSISGLYRRIRLFLIRLKSVWPIAILTTGLIVGLLLIADHLLRQLDKAMLENPSQVSLTSWAGLLSSLAAAGGLLVKFKDIVGGLIANPTSLLASTSSEPTLTDLNAQATFRQRFSQDFLRLIEVLSKRRLVIIIDDLDRCRPENIREIMEGINFLVASGDCVVVLGLARENVEQFLGYSFKNTVVGMSVELLELKPGEVCDADTKPKLYARLYLEKLIQIDVPIPVLREDQARFVISAAPTANNTPLSKEKKSLFNLKSTGKGSKIGGGLLSRR